MAKERAAASRAKSSLAESPATKSTSKSRPRPTTQREGPRRDASHDDQTRVAPADTTTTSTKRTPAKQRLRGDAHALKSRIIGKGADVFGKLGVERTTVEDILKSAGVSRRTFYRFFQGKEDVLDALHEIGCHMLIGAALQTSLGPGTPHERIQRAVCGYFDYHNTVGTNVMHVVQGESMRPGSKLGPRRTQFLDSMVKIWNGEVEAATGKAADPMLLRGLLLAMESTSLTLRVEQKTSPEELQRAKNVMLRMVLATIAAPAGDGVPPLPLAPEVP